MAPRLDPASSENAVTTGNASIARTTVTISGPHPSLENTSLTGTSALWLDFLHNGEKRSSQKGKVLGPSSLVQRSYDHGPGLIFAL